MTTLREERKVITALCADIVGSTALTERLGPEEAKLVLGEAIARIVADVEELGGYVKDLAGDGVLAFFGAPVSSEDDAERAVRAGLAISRTAAAYADEIEQAWGNQGFDVRVGVGTGTVALGPVGGGDRIEYGAYGDSVNLTARLQAAAEPGSVLVDERTHRLVEGVFDWAPPLTLDVKGKADRVRAFEAVGARASPRRRRLEGMQAPLVGREDELSAGREAVTALADGVGGVMFVVGEPGIGKSRLIAELRDEFDGLWLEGRCVSYGESLPYWPYRELIREWLGLGVDDPELKARVALRGAVQRLFEEQAADIYPYLATLLGLALEPAAAERLAELSPEALQYRTFEVVGLLVERLAADRPLVLALEDLHWADSTSVQVTERLLGVGERAGAMLVFTLRREHDRPAWALRELAVREYPHLVRDVQLEPLGGRSDRALLEALVGRAVLPPNLEQRVLEEAEGNPFYLEELVRSLADSGALVREGEGWRFDHEIPVEVPESVEKVIVARVDRLSPSSREVICAAAVLGRHFGLPLLEGTLEAPGGSADALHELQRADLIRAGRRWPEPEYRFAHVLIQEAVYRTLLSETRRELHRRAAEWLERRYADNPDEALGLLAHHWLAAEDEDKAIAYLARAGDRARLEWSLDEAIGHYRALLPLLESRGERQEMALTLFKLALALHTALRFAEANVAYQQAFELWTPSPRCEAPTATLRVGTPALPFDTDPYRTHGIANIELYMALFDRLVEAWPERTIVPSLAERWEISDDGLRYLFQLRDDLRWSDGAPLTAHDVEFGVKRVVDREHPGASVAIYFVLEHAQDYFLGRHDEPGKIGVRALDERTVEFRLAAPAPYFMSVANRPDCAAHPKHAIERSPEGWSEVDEQVVSGAFRRTETLPDRIVLDRRLDSSIPRAGNVGRVELLETAPEEAADRYGRDELDLYNTRFDYPERLAQSAPEDVELGPAAWLEYFALNHRHSATSGREFRLALAHAVDRRALQEAAQPNAIVATGGMVPPPLQGHTPDIAPSFDPDLARTYLGQSGVEEGVEVLLLEFSSACEVAAACAACWEDVLGLRFPVRLLSRDELGEVEVAAAPVLQLGWFPGYPDPEYYLRLLLHSDASDNEGGYASPAFDELIERARQERDGRARLELFHEADRLAVAGDVAAIPLAYVRNVVFVKPWVTGWWEFGKSWSSLADLAVDEGAERR
jgi:ABC-type oligopeptide transport system substrate-binding subunit/class 3 adenylate cyclase